MVKIAVSLFVLCALMAMVALTLIGVAWLGLVVLVLAAGALVSGLLLDWIDDRARRVRGGSGIQARS